MRRRPVFIALAIASLHAVWLATKAGGEAGVTAASDLIQFLAIAVAAGACLIRARNERGADRLAWGLLAGCTAAWAVGAGIWSYYEVVLRVDAPFPSLADAGFLAAVPLAAAGVLAFPALRNAYSRARSLLDGAIIGGSVLFVSWQTVLGPLFRSNEDGPLTRALTLAYPLGDVVIVAAAVSLIARAPKGRRTHLVLVALGLMIFGLSDSTFLFLDLRGLYSTGSFIDLGWTIGPLLVFIGATTRVGTVAVAVEDHAGTRSMLLLPYLPTVIALSAATLEVISKGRLEGFLLWNGLILVLVLVVRQFIMLLDNVALSRGLEARVEERTGELRASEERFRSLVQNSSDVTVVMTKDATITYVSDSMERVFGYTASGVNLKPFVDLVETDDQPRFLATLAEGVDHPSSGISGECRITRRDGRSAEAEIVITNLLHDPSVAGIVLNARDISERKELERQLIHQVFHDPLTSLANRALFRDRVEHAIRRGRRGKQSIGVMFLDLDGFKAINDSLGHEAGDRLLAKVAERFASCVRPGDTVARLGGDEFAILLEAPTNEHDAESVARRILEGSSVPIHLEGRDVFARASIGIAMRTSTTDTADTLLRNADVAMYIAKARGKGRHELFRQDMHAPVLARLETESELRTAIERKNFRLHYQPIVNLHTGRIESLEALLRWEHPERGIVPPDEFIPVAEESGLIHPLGAWVLNQACSEIFRLNEFRGTPLRVAVNLSPTQFQSPDLAFQVDAALRSSGLNPELLTLEITESTVMADTEATVLRLQELKALGIRLAIDDFGTGYSSLRYLRQFPVDILKIDRAFIRSVDAAPEDAALAKAIIKLAQTFRLETVAEGIEHKEQLTTLLTMGCRYGQGYYFAQPQPIEDQAVLFFDSDFAATS